MTFGDSGDVKLSTCDPVTVQLNDQICVRCKVLDFEAFFATSANQLPPCGKYLAPLGQLCDIIKSEACRVCILFASVLPRTFSQETTGSSEVYHLRICPSSAAFRTWSRHRSKSGGESVVLAVVQGDINAKITRNKICSSLFWGVIATATTPYGVVSQSMGYLDLRGKPVNQNTVDYVHIKRWLEECSQNHVQCQGDEKFKSINARLIDCESRRIVPMKPDDAYVALSYVWGSSSRCEPVADTTIQEHDCIPDVVSKTIEDALIVTKNLGLRYLWVDRYCIRQTDMEDKHTQVCNMDNIYVRAFATIAAVSTTEANSGLAGISKPRSAKQASFSIGSRLLTSTLPHLSYFLSQSKWATRGWTYQEAMLSRRCLFFTDEQVYCVCKVSTSCESIQKAPVNTMAGMTRLHPSLFNPLNYRTYVNILPTTSVEYQLIEYTSRQLTYKSDALNAFRGILARSSCYSYWGILIPVANKVGIKSLELVEIGIVSGLCWHLSKETAHLGNRERRLGFPTWSWTSIEEKIRYDYPWELKLWIQQGDSGLFLDEWSIDLAGLYRAQISAEEIDGSLSKLRDVFINMPNGQKIIPELSEAIHVESYMIDIRLIVTQAGSIVATTVNEDGLKAIRMHEREQARLECPLVSLEDTKVVEELLIAKSKVCPAILLLRSKPKLGEASAVWLLFTRDQNNNARRAGIVYSQRSLLAILRGRQGTIRLV